MPRKSKPFNLGDTFLSWTVIECSDAKKYRYLCRCSCGMEKVFYKYNLLRGAYAPCKKCGHYGITKTSLIRKHWNSELNRTPFTKPQDFNLSHSYWFICENGHNFRCSIKDFSLDKCLNCKTKVQDNSLRLECLNYSNKLFDCIYSMVHIEDNYTLIIEDKKVALVFVEKDRFDSYRNYYSSESDFVNDLTQYKLNIKRLCSEGYRVIEINIEKSLLKNVDTLHDIVLELY